MPLPLVLYKSIGVLFTSEGVVKSPLAVTDEDELRGVLGRNAAEVVSAADSPEIALALAPDIVFRRSSSFGQVATCSTSVLKSDTSRSASA